MPNDLSQQSKNYHKQADQLIKESGLTKILNKYGDQRIVGSYLYELMLKPDLDILLIHKDWDRNRAKRLLDELIEQSWWNGYTFTDWVKFRSKKWSFLPKGYYLNLKCDFNDERWKVDIWLLKKMSDNKGYGLEDRLRNATSDQKKAILVLKDARNKGRVKENLSAKVIYDAVLDHNINSVDGFILFLKK